MVPEYVLDENQRKCHCGYVTRKKDGFWVADYKCWHVICDCCGAEWVV